MKVQKRGAHICDIWKGFMSLLILESNFEEQIRFEQQTMIKGHGRNAANQETEVECQSIFVDQLVSGLGYEEW